MFLNCCSSELIKDACVRNMALVVSFALNSEAVEEHNKESFYKDRDSKNACFTREETLIVTVVTSDLVMTCLEYV